MSEGFFSRGFRSRRKPSDESGRLPPGQYLERGFPVLSAGPTPHTPLANWDFSIVGEVDQPKRWTWDEFHGRNWTRTAKASPSIPCSRRSSQAPAM